jgi:vacuolar-type H+-ATPase catalytic subunit A/Vma1
MSTQIAKTVATEPTTGEAVKKIALTIVKTVAVPVAVSAAMIYAAKKLDEHNS